MIEIIEYFNESDNLYFKGTAKEFEEFKKYHGIYPYEKKEENN